MKIARYQDVGADRVTTEDAKDVTIRLLITKNDGAPNFAMRLFEIAPGGRTPLHTHDNEHEVFVLEGEGTVWREGKDVPLRPGTAVFVPGGEKHCFKNAGAGKFQFLCLVPVESPKS
jgi:quercetin dioxygenase-like cupin family protein